MNFTNYLGLDQKELFLHLIFCAPPALQFLCFCSPGFLIYSLWSRILQQYARIFQKHTEYLSLGTSHDWSSHWLKNMILWKQFWTSASSFEKCTSTCTHECRHTSRIFGWHEVQQINSSIPDLFVTLGVAKSHSVWTWLQKNLTKMNVWATEQQM